jgi:peptidoglycan/LPS O-acetylase OafA/YrhL
MAMDMGRADRSRAGGARARLDLIDTDRGVAILSVMLFHFTEVWSSR